MTTVAVHGSYFADNFGDTLLIKLLCDRFAAKVGKHNVFLAAEGHAKEQEAIGYPVLPKQRRHEADMLIYSGGGYFGEPAGTLLHRYRWSRNAFTRHLSWLDDYENARIAILGVGVGPLTLPHIRWPIRKVFQRAEVALVRDQESFDFVQRYSFHNERVGQCVDLALSLEKRPEEGRSGLALHLLSLDEADLRKVIGGLKASGQYDDEPVTVMFDCPINMSSGSHELITGIAREFFRNVGPVQFYDHMDAQLDRLAKYKLVVTSKLHVGIVTVAQGGKAIAVPHHIKTPRLYRQLGLSDFCIVPSDLTEEGMLRAVAKLPEFKVAPGVIEPGVATIYDAVDQMFEVAATEERVLETAGY